MVRAKETPAPLRDLWANHLHICFKCRTLYNCDSIKGEVVYESPHGAFYHECKVCGDQVEVLKLQNAEVHFDEEPPF